MAYDWQGRLNTRQIIEDASPNATVLHSIVRDFDALGRLKSEVNNLGTFTYQYDADNASPKVDAVLYPNGMQADYDDYTVTGSANVAIRMADSKVSIGASTCGSRTTVSCGCCGNST